jgi:hypothetical protein
MGVPNASRGQGAAGVVADQRHLLAGERLERGGD